VTLWYCDQNKAIVLDDELHQAELNDSFALQSTLHECSTAMLFDDVNRSLVQHDTLRNQVSGFSVKVVVYQV